MFFSWRIRKYYIDIQTKPMNLMRFENHFVSRFYPIGKIAHVDRADSPGELQTVLK